MLKIGYVGLTLFVILYLLITLIIPVICFYFKGAKKLKQHNTHRDRIWNKYKDLENIKVQIEDITLNRGTFGSNLSKIMEEMRKNPNLTKDQKLIVREKYDIKLQEFTLEDQSSKKRRFISEKFISQKEKFNNLRKKHNNRKRNT